MATAQCRFCSKTITLSPSILRRGGGKYCSRACQYAYQKAPLPQCKDCETPLTKQNWYPSFERSNNRLCKQCNMNRTIKWREENPELSRQHGRTHYATHRTERLAAKKEWDRNHKPHIRTQNAQHRKKLRKMVLDAYGNCCACCGEAHEEFLTVDHINGDGGAHRKELGSRAMAHLYRFLRDHGFPKDRFRLLCYNCNLARGHYGYCPHEKS